MDLSVVNSELPLEREPGHGRVEVSAINGNSAPSIRINSHIVRGRDRNGWPCRGRFAGIKVPSAFDEAVTVI